MELNQLITLVKKIVAEACKLKDAHTTAKHAPVNYACIFTQNQKEYEALVATANKIGAVVKETPSGLLFHIPPINTVAGDLRLVKIRLPDVTRPERGDADFTILDYHVFKKKYLSKKGFKLIPRENFEMIELMNATFNVRVYFSYPPLGEQLKITKK